MGEIVGKDDEEFANNVQTPALAQSDQILSQHLEELTQTDILTTAAAADTAPTQPDIQENLTSDNQQVAQDQPK